MTGRTRGYLRGTWLLLCGCLGAAMAIRGDWAVAVGLFLGALLGAVLEIARIRRRRKIAAQGEVPYDERDMIVAGKAAILTIRLSLSLLAAGLLVLIVVKPQWSPSILPVMGTMIAVQSLMYVVSYRILRRR